MTKKNILVTGGAGFIGSHLVDRLLAEADWNVTVIDNFNDFYASAEKFANIEKHHNNKSFKLVKADICLRESLMQTFEDGKFDAIVHLAACAGVRPSLEMPLLYSMTNINGTLNLLELAQRYQVKQFIFASSSSVYGINSKVPFAENDQIAQPISPYAATKAAGELLCHTFSHLYDLRCVCLRFFTVYGPRQRPDLAIRKFAELIKKGSPISVYGNGRTRRDYTFIDDIIEGVRAAIDYDRSKYEIINLGESRTVEIYELIEILERELNRPAIIKRLPAQPGDVPQTFADIEKARRLLNYDPQIGIEEGIRRFAKWLDQKTPAGKTSYGILKSGKNTSLPNYRF